MRLLEDVKFYGKEFAYEGYYRILNSPKDYDKITKVKMIEEVFKLYNDYNFIINICTEKELKYLESVLNGTNKEINYNDYRDINLWTVRTLNQKFLYFSYDKEGNGIPQEILESVKLAVKNVDYKKKREEDKINEIAISYVKQLGESIIFPLVDFVSAITSKDKEYIVNHLNNSGVFNYYTTIVLKKIGEDSKEFLHVIHNDYINYIDDINEKRKTDAIAGKKEINLKTFKTLFYYNFDINNKNISKFLDELYKLPVFHGNIIEEIEVFCALNLNRGDLKNNIQNIGSLRYTDLTKFFKLMDKAMDEIPSCALNGLTPNEAMNSKILEMKNEIRKMQQYIPQKNACLDEKDAKLFYKLYFALLDYTNNKYKINPHVKFYNKKYNNPSEMIDIINKLWENKEETFNEFISQNPYKFNDEELKVLSKMKDGKRDLFVIASFENEYTGMLYTNKSYMIKGINDNIDNIISYNLLPCPVLTTILPFKDVLIYDGIFCQSDISIEANIQMEILNEYEKSTKYYHM